MADKATPIDVTSKIFQAQIVPKSFKNDDNETVDYTRLVITVLVKGEAQDFEFSPASREGRSTYSVLNLADDVE